MRPPADPTVPRIVHLEATAWNSAEATKIATKEAIGRGLIIRQVTGARRSATGAGFVVAMIVTGPVAGRTG